MTQQLTLDEFKDLAKKTNRVAVFQEISADSLTPISIYCSLKNAHTTEAVIFEDFHPNGHKHYSFICFESIASLEITDQNQEPLNTLRQLQSELAYTARPDAAELITSSMGFITYDAIRFFENIPDKNVSNSLLPLMLFNFYRISLAFDHRKKTVLISYVVEVGKYPELSYCSAREEIEKIIKLLSINDFRESDSKKEVPTAVDVEVSDLDFINMIEKAKKYITQGDAFQIVLSRCFKRQYSVSPLEIYKKLCEISPAPYMFYFPLKSCVIIGASPEQFIRSYHNKITVNPIAGTRRRQGAITDEVVADDLLNDKKELAEHMMLVDLARNDVGAVADPGSVKVDELLKVKHYSHVSHITSTVTGVLNKKYDSLDAMIAAFPAGTLSGAPKIRAMQIIDELEMSRRGLYGGAICRFDSINNLDSCIAIRSAILKDGIATIRTGAGIVYDSNPINEVQETYHKSQSILSAIAIAHGEKHDITYR